MRIRLAAVVLTGFALGACQNHNSITETAGLVRPETSSNDPRSGNVSLNLTFNVTPSPAWEPGRRVFLYADARRNPNLNQEDIFKVEQYPGTYPRSGCQVFPFTLPDVNVGEKIIVQGYMCAEGTTDCYPSDKDNPPSCGAVVQILDNLKPSCQPTFTWTGGQGNGGVLCHAACN